MNFASSGGVGFCARGYSLESRDASGLGSRTSRGGYALLVVVVVVIVFVSMHSATSNFIRGCGDRASASSQLTDTVV